MPLFNPVPAATTGAPGAVTLQAAPVRFQPANPTGSASQTGLLMMGLGMATGGQACLYTPSNSGLVFASLSSYTFSATAAAVVTAGARYGTYAGPATTVAVGSNGGEISQIAGSWSTPSAGVLAVASTAGYTTTGTLWVAASGSTVGQITYTGISGNTFTGCAYVQGSATGTVATGGAVTGAPPNQALIVGTRWGLGSADPILREPAAGAVSAFTATDLLTLTAGLEYWFDIGLETGASADVATVTNISLVLAEWPT